MTIQLTPEHQKQVEQILELGRFPNANVVLSAALVNFLKQLTQPAKKFAARHRIRLTNKVLQRPLRQNLAAMNPPDVAPPSTSNLAHPTKTNDEAAVNDAGKHFQPISASRPSEDAFIAAMNEVLLSRASALEELAK